MVDQERYGQPEDGGTPERGLGELDWINELQDMIANNPKYEELWGQLKEGLSPRTREYLENLKGSRDYMSGAAREFAAGGTFGEAEEGAYRKMISGETLETQLPAIHRMILDKFKGQRETARESLASRGFTPGGGQYGMTLANLAGEQDEALANALVQQYLGIAGMGTQGLGMMEEQARGRFEGGMAGEQAAAGLDIFGANLTEGARQFGLNFGANLTGQQSQDYMNLLNQQVGYRQYQQQQPNTFQQVVGGLTQAGMAYATGGASNVFSNPMPNTGAGQGQPSPGQMKDWFQ